MMGAGEDELNLGMTAKKGKALLSKGGVKEAGLALAGAIGGTLIPFPSLDRS